MNLDSIHAVIKDFYFEKFFIFTGSVGISKMQQRNFLFSTLIIKVFFQVTTTRKGLVF